MKYIIKLIYTDGGIKETDYIGNGTYVVNHNKYAVITQNQNEAKTYSSYKRAENAFFSMRETCYNVALANGHEILEISQ